MYKENYFVPKILICGDKAEFLARIGQRPFKLVGEVNFVGEAEGQQFHFLRDGKFSIDGKLHNYPELINILKGGGTDYLVFNDSRESSAISNVLKSIGCARSQLVSLREFKTMQIDAFYDVDSDNQLMMFLKSEGIKTLLDINAHFAKSQLLTKGINDLTQIDCISEEELLPIKENIYSRIYKKFSDCQFRHYDAALVYGETNIDFITTFSALEGITDAVITFAQYGSEFEKYLGANVSFFERIDFLPSFAGRWFICRRHTKSKDFAMYVVTHKALPPEHVEKLPAGYKVIHAGRAISQDLGYLGDNTGDNISHLNPYINEFTALYWMWKNTSHSVIGFSHYRRFFTESEEKPFTEINDLNFSYDKILTEEAAERLLQNYDIIVTRIAQHYTTQFEDIKDSVGSKLARLVKNTMRKNLSRLYPDYEKFFDYVMDSPTYYECNMFITQNNIFDAYCKWLFSFVLDSFYEISKQVPLEKFEGSPRRAVAYFIERMFTVWLIKNPLRVKEINKMFVHGI